MIDSDRRAEALAALDTLRGTLEDASTHHGVVSVIADDLADTLDYVRQVAQLPDLAAAGIRD